eukprot:242743_1
MSQEEHKYEHKEESDSDDQQEVMVHGTDLREPIHELGDQSFRKSSFIKCIGQLCMEYNYPQKDYKQKLVGTGTVIRTKSNGWFDPATAFVLTAAHTVRHNVWNCCNIYFDKVDSQGDKITNCIKCKKKLDKNTDATVIDATSIVFKRRKTTTVGFGTMEKRYKCKIECLDDIQYKQFPYPKSGYDWAILSFLDDENYYWKNCTNIQLGSNSKFEYKQFMIVGYPAEKTNEMWGYIMNQDEQTVKCEVNNKTGNRYVMHKEVDASAGQSGAAIATQINGKTIIWGIHVGGNKKGKYNVGTMITGFLMWFLYNSEKALKIKEVCEALAYFNFSVKDATDISIWNEREVKRRFRQLALLAHPDKSGGSVEKFTELSFYYRILIACLEGAYA